MRHKVYVVEGSVRVNRSNYRKIYTVKNEKRRSKQIVYTYKKKKPNY